MSIKEGVYYCVNEKMVGIQIDNEAPEIIGKEVSDLGSFFEYFENNVDKRYYGEINASTKHFTINIENINSDGKVINKLTSSSLGTMISTTMGPSIFIKQLDSIRFYSLNEDNLYFVYIRSVGVRGSYITEGKCEKFE